MPQRIPVAKIILHREGKRFSPPLGKPFNFTAEELEDINLVNKNAVRKVINETAEASKQDETQDDTSANKQDDTNKPATGTNKPATGTNKPANAATPGKQTAANASNTSAEL